MRLSCYLCVCVGGALFGPSIPVKLLNQLTYFLETGCELYAIGDHPQCYILFSCMFCVMAIISKSLLLCV